MDHTIRKVDLGCNVFERGVYLLFPFIQSKGYEGFLTIEIADRRYRVSGFSFEHCQEKMANLYWSGKLAKAEI